MCININSNSNKSYSMCIPGKTTLLHQTLRPKDGRTPAPEEKDYHIPGFSFYEAIVRHDIMDNNFAMTASSKQHAEVCVCGCVFVIIKYCYCYVIL